MEVIEIKVRLGASGNLAFWKWHLIRDFKDEQLLSRQIEK